MNFESAWHSLSELLTRPTANPLQALWPWQLVALVAIGIIARFIGNWIGQRVHLHRKEASPATVATVGYSLVDRFALPAVVCGLALCAWLALEAAGASVALVLALALLAALLLVARLLVFAITRLAVPGFGLTLAERAAGWAVWLIVVLLLLHGSPQVTNSADAIAISIGSHKISLLDTVSIATVLVLFIVAAAYLGKFIEGRVLALEQLPIGVRVATAKISRVLLVVVATLAALNVVGVDLISLTVLGGAVGVGLGFGLQRIASNFVSGFILLGDRSIRPGDVITIGSRFGVVRELRARYIVVRDRDGVDTLIPNENIITSEVVNWSYADRQIRLKLPIQISYADKPREAMRLMESVALLHPRVEKHPAPVSRIMSFADNGIELELRFWIRDPEDGVNNVRSDLYLSIWDAFQTAAITIPYPQRVVHYSGDTSMPLPLRATNANNQK